MLSGLVKDMSERASKRASKQASKCTSAQALARFVLIQMAL